MPSDTPEVSLVFVTTNEGAVLIDALESLFASDVELLDMEVLVIDNASTDGARDRIRDKWPDVRVLVRDQNYGLPSNLNYGIQNSNGSLVMLCNSDLVFEPGSVETMVRFFRDHPRAGIVAPQLISPEGETRPSARRWYTVPVLIALKGPWKDAAGNLQMVQRNIYGEWDYSSPLQVDWVPCPATMVRRAAFDEVGLMDERFRLYFDDVDISLRMHRASWEVWCVPEARIVHIEQRSSVKAFSAAWRWHLISLLKFVLKHKGLSP